MLMKKVTVVAALLLFLPFVVKAKDGNVAGWKPNKTPETPELDVTAPPFVFNVSETNELVRVTLDVAARGDYTAFMTELHGRLKATANGRTIKDRPVLGKQKLHQQPDTWIYVDLKWGGEMPTLAIRADNLYLVGFQPNRGGPWYQFENTFRRVGPLLPGSISLTFNDTYKSLAGGRGYRDLDRVVVGQQRAWEAAKKLASYQQGDQQKIREALLTFVLMICEAERLTSIYKAVSAAWEYGDRPIPKDVVELVVQWKNISCALLGLDRRVYWNDIPEAKEIAKYGNPKMTSPSNAAANLNVILLATTCKPI